MEAVCIHRLAGHQSVVIVVLASKFYARGFTDDAQEMQMHCHGPVQFRAAWRRQYGHVQPLQHAILFVQLVAFEQWHDAACKLN